MKINVFTREAFPLKEAVPYATEPRRRKPVAAQAK